MIILYPLEFSALNWHNKTTAYNNNFDISDPDWPVRILLFITVPIRYVSQIIKQLQYEQTIVKYKS